VKPYHPREQVREEPLGIAQEGMLGLHAPQLLQEGEGDDLRVREPLERFVAPPAWVEESVGVVDEAEQDGEGLFRSGEPLGMVGVAICCSFARGDYDGPLSTLNPRNAHLENQTHNIRDIDV
jgi:hypothetical protein